MNAKPDRRDASPSSRSPQPDSLPAGATTSTGAIGGDGLVEGSPRSPAAAPLPAWPPVALDPVTPDVRDVVVYTNGRMTVQLTAGLQRGYIRGNRADIEEWLFWLSADLAGLPADAGPGVYHAEQGRVTSLTVRLGTVNVHVDDPTDIELVPDYEGAPALRVGTVTVTVLSGGVLGLRDRLLQLGADLNRAAGWLDARHEVTT